MNQKLKKVAVGMLTLSVMAVTATGCGEKLQDVSDKFMNGEFSFDAEELEGVLWNEEWETYDVSEMSLFDENFPIIKDTESYTETVAAAGILNLEASLGGCAVTIEASPDTDYHVIVEKVSAFQTYVLEETLYIRGLQNGTWNGNLNSNMYITLQIPEGIEFENVNMSLGAGDFSVASLLARNVEIEVGAGRLQVTNLAAETMKAEIGAGQLVIENAEVLSGAELETGAGELLFTGRVPGDLKAECAMGNMEINIVGSTEADHNLDMECVAGNLTVGSYTNEGLGEQSVDNGVSSDYEFECAMGNMTVTFR